MQSFFLDFGAISLKFSFLDGINRLNPYTFRHLIRDRLGAEWLISYKPLIKVTKVTFILAHAASS